MEDVGVIATGQRKRKAKSRLYAMIQDNLVLPFETTALGVPVSRDRLLHAYRSSQTSCMRAKL